MAGRTGRRGRSQHGAPLGPALPAPVPRGGAPPPPAGVGQRARGRDVPAPERALGLRVPGHRRGAGRVVDVYVSERRNAAAARAFFERASDETAVRPDRVTTDKAGCYPPALRAVLPGAEHRAAKYLNNGLERDHGHLKQRVRPMRGFKILASADVFSCGHGLIQNLRNGFSTLKATLPRPLRLLTAWPQLAQMISAA